jgi:hypothetical protein
VAPIPIEDRFKEEFLPCANVVLVGEGQRFIGCLITFKVDLGAMGLPSQNLMKEAIDYFAQNGVEVKTTTEAIQNPKVGKLVQEAIDRTNLKTVSRAA